MALQASHELVIFSILLVKISIYIGGKSVIGQYQLLFCLTNAQKKKKKKSTERERECVCLCVSLCILDREGSRMFASRALV